MRFLIEWWEKRRRASVYILDLDTIKSACAYLRKCRQDFRSANAERMKCQRSKQKRIRVSTLCKYMNNSRLFPPQPPSHKNRIKRHYSGPSSHFVIASPSSRVCITSVFFRSSLLHHPLLSRNFVLLHRAAPKKPSTCTRLQPRSNSMEAEDRNRQAILP